MNSGGHNSEDRDIRVTITNGLKHFFNFFSNFFSINVV